MKAFLAPAALLALMIAPAAEAAPSSWTVVAPQSRIGFSGSYSGNKFAGRFANFSADIRFDPKDLPHSSARVVIATASGQTGDNFQDTTLKSEEWFDVQHFPRAAFVTRKISATGPGRYVADGVLTVRNKAVPVRLPFALKGNGNVVQMQGSATLDRIALGLGTKSDPNGSWVSKTIAVTVNLVARKGR